jgi:L-ascorbate metabolism protein UlaG (beta-lactamase superfamily)
MDKMCITQELRSTYEIFVVKHKGKRICHMGDLGILEVNLKLILEKQSVKV